MTQRLSDATLAQLPTSVRRPSYDRNALRPGVVHIGLGAFHRAHQAPVFQMLAEAGDMRWGVSGASLRSPGVRDALAPQDFLYSLNVEDGDCRDVRILDVIGDVIVASEQPARLVEAVAAPETQIVTVTVTEKGYGLEADAMPAFLAAGLRLRRARELPPLTLISCDNIASNGEKLRSTVTDIARAQDAGLGDWIDNECAFPSTMVDRIVPAATEADIEVRAAQLRVVDRAPVRTEPFWQWVIEDRFVRPRPYLESTGVQITKDIGAWEQAKLRLLNGAHSAMAYLGILAGLNTVDRFVSKAWGRRFVERLWDEVEPSLARPPQLDVRQYRRDLMRRFENAALGHRLLQIAMDGSKKIPQRLVRPAVDLVDGGAAPSAIALTIAAWIRCQSGRNDAGRQFEVDDPFAAAAARLLAGRSNAREQAAALIGVSSIFPARLSTDASFVALVADQLEDLRRLGAQRTVERFLEAR